MTSTDLCLEGPFEQFSQRMGDCRTKASSILDEALSNFDEFENLLCKSIEEEVRCFDTIGPDCLDQRLLNINKYNYLSDMYENIYNLTFLGEDYIKSCPTTSRLEDFVVSTLTDGSAKCTYFEVEALGREYGECLDNANSRVSTALLLANSGLIQNPRAFYVQAQCQFKQTALEVCVEDYLLPCHEEPGRIIFRDQVNGFLEKREASLDEALNGFSFSQCPQNN